MVPALRVLIYLPHLVAMQVSEPAADVFALGLIMLQLLTGSQPNGLAQHAVEVMRADGVARLIDPCAGEWPLTAASEFCSLAIRCGSTIRLCCSMLATIVTRQSECSFHTGCRDCRMLYDVLHPSTGGLPKL